ncbi:hypothetical protein Tco_0838632 [Tanacetum coccineum]|uniref:Uncharacterized protein n=1 Tax=Tanacetum coccineum TaxID=301880 RepID=A0ABQ5ANC4_9ASTR
MFHINLSLLKSSTKSTAPHIINHILLTLQSDLGDFSPTDKPNREPNQHTCLTHPVIQNLSFLKLTNLLPRIKASVQDGRYCSECSGRQTQRTRVNNARGQATSKENCNSTKRPQNPNTSKTSYVAGCKLRDIGVVLVESASWWTGQMLLMKDVAPTAQTMFMANLSSADLVCDKAGPSYDSDVLSEVHDHDHYQDVVLCKGHVCWLYIINASMVPNDAYVMIDNDVHESDVLSVSHTPQNIVVNNLLNAKLATYKEQVELYERRARFELTEREQKIDEQLRK